MIPHNQKSLPIASRNRASSRGSFTCGGDAEVFLRPMKVIQERFKRWGGDWQILERNGDIALFLQDGRNYNVAIIQHSEPREIAGRMIEGGEYLPGETQYGSLAWNYGINEDAAREKFTALIHERENPKPKQVT